MKVLVTGVKGQLGYDVVRRLSEKDIECIGVDKEDFDLTQEDQVISYIQECKPDVVVHCAAYTAVDKAEDDKNTCFRVNVLGTEHIAKACKDIDAKMIYISTDYVFNGKGVKAFEVDDSPNPSNYYGESKYQGEQMVKKYLKKYFIVRTSWVFGSNGNNFVKTMLKLGKERSELNVVCDQVGSPTYTYDLAKLLVDMINTEKYGIYHATNEGYCSWYDFACEIFRLAQYNIKINPVSSEEYVTKAIRPKNSRLSKRTLDENGFCRLPNWKDSLEKYLEEVILSVNY